MKRRAEHGFTLIEMLIVLAIVGILVAVGTVSLVRWRNKAQAENFVQGFAADMNRYRTLSASTGTPYRVRLTGASSYVVEQGTLSSNVNTYGGCTSSPPKLMTADPTISAITTVTTQNNAGVTVDLSGATIFQFDSRGNMCAFTSAGAPTQNTNLSMNMTQVGVTRSVIVTALGLAKAVQ